MADIVNLNRARKAKAAVERKAQAAANRVAFGRIGAVKERDRLEAAQAAARLDGLKLERDDG